MQTKKKSRSMLLTLNLVLILALISCTSYPKRENEEIAIPVFPSFPSPMKDGQAVVILNIEDNIVSMPYWYWQSIATYAIDTEAAIERLKIDLGGFK